MTIVSNTLLSDRTTVTAWLTQIDDTSLPYFYRCRHLFATITRTKNATITRLTRSKALAISIRKAPNGKAVGDENVPSYLYSAFQFHIYAFFFFILPVQYQPTVIRLETANRMCVLPLLRLSSRLICSFSVPRPFACSMHARTTN